MHQRNRVTAIGEAATIDAVDMNRGIPIRESSWIGHQNNKVAWRDKAADGEGVVDAIGETQATQLEISACDVFQFDELKFIPVNIGGTRRMIHDFGNQQIREVLDYIKSGFGQWAP